MPQLLVSRVFRDFQAVLTMLCALALLVSFFPGLRWVAYVSVLFGSYFALKSSWGSLRERAVDVNLLMVLAAIGAVVVGQPRDAAALLFLFSLSSTLEAFAMARTRNAIEGLVKLRPSEALLVTGAEERRVPVEQLKLDDLVRVRPFETIPVDGLVFEGLGSVNQSAMTGESVPVSREPGDVVIGGTQNLEGMLLIKATSTVGDSTLDRIVSLVADAQENKASGERISTWFGQRYTFFVLGMFVLSLIVRLAIHIPTNTALYESLVLLVALSPCALVISTPATTLSALAWSARHGILIRGGEFIEAAGKIDTIALDKTGTLTAGKPRLVEICVCAGKPVVSGSTAVTCGEEGCWASGQDMSTEARALLRLAAGAEWYASHPVAEAVLASARDHEVGTPEVTHSESVPGLGVSATVDGMLVHVGKPSHIEAQGISIPEAFRTHFEELQHKGMTVAILAAPSGLAALGFQDEPRKEAADLVCGLHAVGVKRVVMVTGDTQQTADVVAQHVGIDQVRAGLLPDEKAEAIHSLVSEGGQVMMVGDGINDAPSLAYANVGVAMGGLGSDIALNAADIVLMHDRLDRIPQLIRLGKQTNGIIKANLLFAGGMIVTLTIASFLTKLPLPLAVIGHEGSTVLVILNGLRLLRGPG